MRTEKWSTCRPECDGGHGYGRSCNAHLPHRYESGVFWDTAPGEAIGCCDMPPGHPVHLVGESSGGEDS